MRSVAGGIDGIGAVFDDGSLVADGGLLLAGTVMSRLGLEALIDDTVRPGGSAGAGAGAKVLTLVASVLVGGVLYRRRAAAGVGLSGWGAAVRAVGAVDAGDVFEVVHVRACAPSSTRPRRWGLCGRGLWAPRRAWRR